MHARLQRVVAFVALSVIFGVSIWISDTTSPNPQVLLAVGVGTGAGSIPKAAGSTPANVADDTANKQCPDARRAFYDPKLRVGACPPQSGVEAMAPTRATQLAGALFAMDCTRKNAYGKLCQYSQNKLIVEGKCISYNKCRGEKYVDSEGRLCELSESGAIDACTARGSTGQKAYSDLQKDLEKLNSSSESPATVSDVYKDNQVTKTFDEAFTARGNSGLGGFDNKTNIDLSALSRSGGGTGVGGLGGDAYTGISDIASNQGSSGFNSGSSNAGGSFVSGMPSTQNYFPTGIFNSLSSLGGPSNNYAPGGGSIAYVSPVGGTAYLPTGPVSVTNTSFDALSSQVTFGDSLQTPYGSISQLSKNPRLTAEERAVLALLERSNQPVNKRGQSIDTSILRSSLTDATSNIVGNVRDVISGVADFFASMFVPPGDRELSEEEKAAEETREALRFFLEPQENVLAIGDPETLPTEIPDDDLRSAQGPGGSFSQSEAFSSGDTAANSNSDAVGAIANPQGQTTGGGGAAGTDASASGEASDAAPGAAGSESIEEDSSEPQGVVAKVKKAIGSLVSNVANAIKSGFLRVLSWFF